MPAAFYWFFMGWCLAGFMWGMDIGDYFFASVMAIGFIIAGFAPENSREGR